MYRHHVSIEQETTVTDSLGGQSVTWSEAFRWYCDVEAVRGREQEGRLGRLATVETYLLTGRYDPRITTLHRVNWNGKLLNIRAAQDRKGRRQETIVEAEAGVRT